MEKVHKESVNKEKLDETNQPQSIAERLLQQCLIPVPVQPLQPSSKHVIPSSTNNKECETVKRSEDNNSFYDNSNSNAIQEIDNLFKCKICHKHEQISRLSYHARNEHNIQDISEATRVCLSNNKDSINNNEDILKSSIEPNIDFPDIGESTTSFRQDGYGRMNCGRNDSNESQEAMNSPPWCEGAFPSDLEDVALSPPSESYNGNSLGIGLDQGNLNCGVGFSNMEDINSSSCSPPSVGDLASLNPQDHFDPDFDVVDEMKFIDCLIQTIEPTQNNNVSESNSALDDVPLSNSEMDQGAHDDAASSEEETKPTLTDIIPRINNNNASSQNQSSIENNLTKTSQFEVQSQNAMHLQPPLRHFPKPNGGIGMLNNNSYPTSTSSCMLLGPNQPPNNMSTMPSHFKFGHSNTINVSFSNSKILFPHAHQNSVILPPPIPAFMQLPSTSSRVNSSQQQSSNNPFCNNTSLKAPISSNNDFILSKMSNIPAASTNGN